MPFPVMGRRSRGINSTSTPLKDDSIKENKQSPTQSEKSSPSVKTIIEAGSLSRKSKGQPPISSHLPLPPPATPTRSLLQRIQRRSSTSAESITSNQSSLGKKTIRTSAVIPKPVTSTPPPVKAASKAASTVSTGATSVKVGESKLPRHRKSISLLGNGSTPPKRSVSTGKAESTRIPSQIATNRLADDYITKRTSSAAVVRVSKGSTGITNVRRHSAMIPSATKTSPLQTSTALPASSPIPSIQSKAALAARENDEKDRMRPVSPVHRDKEASHDSLSFHDATWDEVSNLTLDPSKLLRDICEKGNGLTRLTAQKLEYEFSSQERILEGLQRDNELKTIEVEELKRKLARIEESCAKIFGKESWRDMVFSSSPRSSESNNEKQGAFSRFSEKKDSFGGGEGDRSESGKDVKSVNKADDSIALVEDLLQIDERTTKTNRDSDLFVNISSQKKDFPSHSRDHSGVETITDHPKFRRQSSIYTSSATEDPSYFSASESLSSSVLSKNGTEMISVRKDLLKALVEAQRQLTDHLSLDNDMPK